MSEPYFTRLVWAHAETQWHPGMYEGLTEAQAKSQVGKATDEERRGFVKPYPRCPDCDLHMHPDNSYPGAQRCIDCERIRMDSLSESGAAPDPQT